MTRLHRSFFFFLVGFMLLSVCPLADGQTKFSLWFRERIGERKAKDKVQAKADAKWQKENFASPEAKTQFLAAMKELKVKCFVCHLDGEKKDVRNVFGAGLSEALREQLQMDGDAISAALKSSAPAADSEKVTKAFYQCLDKALAKPVDAEKKDFGTYADRVKNGQLPVTP